MQELLAASQIDSQMVVLVPAILIIGRFLKNTPIIPDWLIVWILLGLCLVLGLLVYGLTPAAFLNGVLVAGSSVMANQLYKQTQEGISIYKETTNTTPDDEDPQEEINEEDDLN